MTALNKQALRDRYSPQPVPKCHICGSVMTIARASAGAVVYACSGCTYDDNGAHYAPGRSLGDDHYSASRVTIFESGDPEVLALLDELEATKHTAAVDHEAACSLVEENEELKRRIAELEARTVVVKQFDDFQIVHYGGSEDYAKGYIDCQNNYNKALAAAGIGVKGE